MTEPAGPPDLDALLASLSLQEQAALTAGADLWHTVGLPEHDPPIPDLRVTDGPSGARGDIGMATTATGFPAGVALGASWDVDLLADVGDALAAEARSKGAQVLLAPTVNLHRHPLAGRNFECYSEDPELTARLAVAYIEGLQAGGVGASIKHFVGNDQEFERNTISSEIGDLTLRELYLRPFEAAVAVADPWTVMASYNRINGTYASEHHRLIVEILKTEWRWDGLVMSDWFGTHDTLGAALGGLDLEMPGRAKFLGPELAEAVDAGDVPPEVVEDKARRMLRLLARTGRFDGSDLPEERSEETPERNALARRAVSSSVTLLKDDAGLLPLAADLGSIVVVGPGGKPGFDAGGGSSQLAPHHRTAPASSLADALPGTDVQWQRGTALGGLVPPIHRDLLEGGAWRARFWSPADADGAPTREEEWPELRWSFLGRQIPDVDLSDVRAELETVLTPDQDGSWTVSLAGAGTIQVAVDGTTVLRQDDQGPEFSVFAHGLETRTAQVDLQAGVAVPIRVQLTIVEGRVLPHLYLGLTPPDPMAEIRGAAASAADADVAVVVVGTGLDFESEGFDRDQLGLPGDQDALVEAVLDAQPRTVVVIQSGAAVTMPWIDRAPTVVWAPFGGQEAGAGLADVLTGAADAGGRLPFAMVRRREDVPSDGDFPGADGKVHYREGLLIGQRGLDAAGVEALFPLGHGRSFGSTTWQEPRATAAEVGAPVWVTVPVANSSDRPVAEVVQVYVDPPAGDGEGRPPRQLAGFAKAHLDPGEQVDVEVELRPRTFALWDVGSGAWRVPEGRRTLWVGRSATDLPHQLEIDVPAALLATPQP